MPISADFPFESQFVDVLGSRMHYIEEGTGDPIVFLHGNPTSSYLWRNVIPHASGLGRCIAPDLIGMGKSDKPKLDYRFEDHYRYLELFIDRLGLDKMILVGHDWGSGLGFHFAAQHPDRIRGIVFMESIVRTLKWQDFPAKFKIGFKLMRTPNIGWFMVSVMNVFVELILPQATVRRLTEKEMNHYRNPYPTIDSRKPVRVWPCEIPINGEPERMTKTVNDYCQKLQESTYPKLLLHARPGGLIPSPVVEWCKNTMMNLTTVDIGEGIHYIQEDHPHEIGQAIAGWMQKHVL